MYFRSAVAVLIVAYLPGTLIFRLPLADRSKRASLPVEERVFWGILLSLALSSFEGLALVAAGWYRFDRLLWINGAVSLLIGALVRARLRFGSTAPSLTLTALVPVGLVAAGLWLNFFVPPSEFIMGGRDPGVYMNEGIQIAQRGTIVIHDEVVRSVPPPYRGLFFRPSVDDPTYYSNRFMGFFLLDPGTGAVVGQFPHLYPVWIAIAYGVSGLSGAREVLGVWAVLGLTAVYFAGTRIMGRTAAAAGAGLLAVHVVQVWFARYPNAELVMQPLVFAGILAYERAELDPDPFFAPVAALLLVLTFFAHLTGVLVVGAVAITALIAFVDGRRVGLPFGLTLVVGTCVAAAYLARFIPPYFNVLADFVRILPPVRLAFLALAAIVGAGLLRGTRRARVADRGRWVGALLVVAVWTLAAYAFFIRSAGGLLAAFDADSLRTFTSFYLSSYGLVAALVGFTLIARSFRGSAAFLLTFSAFSFLFFYKIRIVPEHFWMARRFVAVTLPGTLLLVGAAAFGDVRFDAERSLAWLNRPIVQTARYVLGLALVLLLGSHFLAATYPILRHVEYAGLIPRLEQLAAKFGDDDLVMVESRGASDVHVLALPLAYIYARNVLIFATTDPRKPTFREFLTWAHERYRRVFFIGGGGTELLSRTMTVKPIGGERFQIPEYESRLNVYPRGVRFKEFDLGVYEFLPHPAAADGFDLDVGVTDDLYVRRFHAKERRSNGLTFRWTRDTSFVSIVGTRPEQRLLTLWMDSGGRPPGTDAASVEVFLNDRALGTVTVGAGPAPYRFNIPPELAAAIAQSEDAAQLRIVTSTWNPARLWGVSDDRNLGVMLDRVQVK